MSKGPAGFAEEAMNGGAGFRRRCDTSGMSRLSSKSIQLRVNVKQAAEGFDDNATSDCESSDRRPVIAGTIAIGCGAAVGGSLG